MKKSLFYLGLFIMSLSIQTVNGQSHQTRSAHLGKTTAAQKASVDKKNESKKKKAQYVEGEVLIKFKPNVHVPESADGKTDELRSADASGMQQVFSKLGVTGVKQISSNMNRGDGTRGNAAAKSNIYKLSFDTTVISTKKAIEYLKKQDGVLIVEPNYKRKRFASPSGVSNPLFGEQWAINATNIQELWKVPTITGKRPVISIIDTGLDVDHVDFSGNVWTNEAEANGLPGVDDDGNGYIDDVNGYNIACGNGDVSDFEGHGTHCAGIAAAKDNSKGVVGMNPDALIMPVRVFDEEDYCETEYILEALSYAVANGADVISLSLGGFGSSELEKEAFDEASKYAVVVAAAGNETMDISSGNISFPAGYPSVLAVASSDSTGNLSYFSNTDEDGPITSNFTTGLEAYNYELIAPGSDIVSTMPSGYGGMSGTSMACPCMAGIISRLLQCKKYDDRLTLKLDLINACKGGCIDAMKAYEGHDNKDFSATLLTVKYVNKDGKEYDFEFVSEEEEDFDEDEDEDEDEEDIKGQEEEEEEHVRFMAGDVVFAYPVLVNYGAPADNIKIKFHDIHGATLNTDMITVDHIGTGDTVKVGPVIFSINAEDEETEYNDSIVESPSNSWISGLLGEISGVKYSVSVDVDNETTTSQKIIPVYKEDEEEEDPWYYADEIIKKGHTTTISGYHYFYESLIIPEGDTLIIKPGSHLEFASCEFNCEGKLICKSKAGQKTVIELRFCTGFSFRDTMERVTFYEMKFDRGNLKGGHFKTCDFSSIQGFFDINRVSDSLFAEGCTFDYCLIKNIEAERLFSNCKFKNCTLSNIAQTDTSAESVKYLPNLKDMSHCNVYNNKFGDSEFIVSFYSDTAAVLKPEFPSYLGSDVDSIIRKGILDASNPTHPIGAGVVDLSNKLTRHSETTPPEIIHVYLNETEMDLSESNNRHEYDDSEYDEFTNHDDLTFPEQVPFKIVFSAPVRKEYGYVSNAYNISWTSDTVLTGWVSLGLWRSFSAYFSDPTNFFDEIEYNAYRLNIVENEDDKLKMECLKNQSIKLTWEEIENSNQYISVNVYGINMTHEDNCSLKYTLLEQIDPSMTSIKLDTKRMYAGYCIKLEDKIGEESDIYNIVLKECDYEDGEWGFECEVPEMNIITALEIINLINGVEHSFFGPDPACFDVNEDDVLNIQDFIYVYNSYKNELETAGMEKEAVYSVENNILYVESSHPITAVEAYFEGDYNATFEAQSGLDNMEHFVRRLESEDYQLLAYSFSGDKVPTGKQPLLKLNNGAKLKSVLLSDSNGNAFELTEGKNIEPSTDKGVAHYFDISGREIMPSAIGKKTGVYIKAYENGGKLKESEKFMTK